jgi:hypothetical protein
MAENACVGNIPQRPIGQSHPSVAASGLQRMPLPDIIR